MKKLTKTKSLFMILISALLIFFIGFSIMPQKSVNADINNHYETYDYDSIEFTRIPNDSRPASITLETNKIYKISDINSLTITIQINSASFVYDFDIEKFVDSSTSNTLSIENYTLYFSDIENRTIYVSFNVSAVFILLPPDTCYVGYADIPNSLINPIVDNDIVDSTTNWFNDSFGTNFTSTAVVIVLVVALVLILKK